MRPSILRAGTLRAAVVAVTAGVWPPTGSECILMERELGDWAVTSAILATPGIVKSVAPSPKVTASGTSVEMPLVAVTLTCAGVVSSDCLTVTLKLA